MAGESCDATVENVVVYNRMKLNRVVQATEELSEGETGGNCGDGGSCQHKISNLRDTPESVKDNQNNAKHEEFPDLR